VAGENAYLDVFTELQQVPIAERTLRVDSLIVFLNRWACHFPTKTAETRNALRGWIERERDSLSALAPLSLRDAALPAHSGEYERLYRSLIALKDGDGPRIPTMGDAAASKILHLMVPPLFVMWDKKIKGGLSRYADFQLQMHNLALRLYGLAPIEARTDLDGYLQRKLGYPIRKPLAKYIDEYNWWLVWGRRATDQLEQ
jgi:hypothetical protein